MTSFLKKLPITFVGATISAAALDLFLIPSDIAPGGASGLAIVLGHIMHIPVGILIVILNIPVFVLAARRFNLEFVLSSLFGMFSLSVMTEVLSKLEPLTDDLILSSVYGGALLGLGMGTVFRAGTTTGGTDIAAMLLKKSFSGFSVGRFVLLNDAVIVTLAGLVYHRWEVALYSAAALFVSSHVLDLIVEGVDFAKVVYIISDIPASLAREISDSLSRGTTAISGSSIYSGTEKTVLMCVVKKYEIGKLKRIIREADSRAFVIVSDAREVLGNGFKSC